MIMNLTATGQQFIACFRHTKAYTEVVDGINSVFTNREAAAADLN